MMFKRKLQLNGAKSSTVALYLSAIRRFFSWTESEGLYPNITAGVKSPKQDKGHKKDALSGGQIKSCLEGIDRATVQGKRDYAMFLLMSVCGLRTCEVARANVEDIRQVQGVDCLFVQGKGRSDKKEFVKLCPEVAGAIRDYLDARGPVEDSAPLFASCSRRNRGGRLTTRTISSVAKRAMVKAGYASTRLTAHSLRHSAATLALQAGMSLEEVSEFLRHSSIAVTMIYVHSVNRLKSQCESAVTRAIFAA
ncbi:MAG: tyrosine-type recombinase/integrase [Prevotella sp.]|nr:tyrosine-type recombinase/integrase [Prevotella sp.]